MQETLQEISGSFTGLDWVVVVAYLAATTWIGHHFSGQQATIRDFFLGGRRLPWMAVCGSIIATEISALTFIGVPGMVYAAGGDFTYLQWAVGSVMARFIVGLVFVPVFYEREIYSPYDYMEARLGSGVKRATTFLFFVGSILGQSVRVLVTAIILQAATGMPFEFCIVAIGVFAVLWTCMGGMTTVIWTDVVQFGVFILGGVLALGWIVASLPGGWGELWQAGLSTATEGNAWGKFRVLNLTIDPAVGFTLWVGLLAMPFQNMAAFGTDQLNAQRMFCCRSKEDAAKAMIFSSVGQLITMLMLLVGVGLFAYYREFVPDEAVRELFEGDHDYVFPVWITTVLPAGVSGLICAGAFAAAISSLDSILAALSQTSLSLYYGKEGLEREDSKRMLLRSRLVVLAWGVALVGFSILLDKMRGDINMVNLAFGMVTYTYGPMLGIFLLALFFRDLRVCGIWVGVVLSMALTLWVRPDGYTILANFEWITPEEAKALRPALTYAWLYPVTCAITFVCGLIPGRRRGRGAETLEPKA